MTHSGAFGIKLCGEWLCYPIHEAMAPRTQPKCYQLFLKTHKLTILLTVSPGDTIASLKREALSALNSDVGQQVDEVPRVAAENEFVLCHLGKERPGASASPGNFVVLEESKQVKDALSNWEEVFFRFKDDSGRILPVEHTPFSDDEPDGDASTRGSSAALPIDALSAVAIGKRKALPE